uniref:C2H2-type domain-containing protein n=1 Tax=Oryzias latipes TaxID=8090 RepID=A0A3P9I1G7_ORYLA
MKPVSYQSMPSSLNGGHPNFTLDRLLSTSSVKYCEKCGFASTDAAVYKKHMMEHAETRFYCFICNHVYGSEAELSEHLQQHTSKFPLKCPHCGQGYMRKRCLVKHIERLHTKNINQGPGKPGVTKSPLVSVPSALTSASTADRSLLPPVVHVTVPTPIAPTVRLGKDEQRGKTLNSNVSNVVNGNIEHMSALQGLIQHNRALTVSLPEEVSIPAGCLVELMEVKTVNGTKELKLRLISKQENESVIKETRTAASHNILPEKPPSSTLHCPNTSRSVSMGMCTVNRKPCEINVERPAVIPASAPKKPSIPVSKEMSGLKRTSPEIINLEAVIPNKVSKSLLNPVREGNSGYRLIKPAPVNHNTGPPAVICSKVVSRLSTTTTHAGSLGNGVLPKVVEDRKTSLLEHPKSIATRRPSDNIRDLSAAVKVEAGQIHLKSKPGKEVGSLNQQSTPVSKPSSLPVVTAPQTRPPSALVGKESVAKKTFPTSRNLSIRPSIQTPSSTNQTNRKMSSWIQEAKSKEMAGGYMSQTQNFPVISSVFSLSEQPQEGQGLIQPLVMALRGIVMDKNHVSCSPTQDHGATINDTEQTCMAASSEQRVNNVIKLTPSTCKVLPMEKKSESVKEEVLDKSFQHPPVVVHKDTPIKEEGSVIEAAGKDKNNHAMASESPECKESKCSSNTEAPVAAENRPPQTGTSQDVISSKFLTISLKRVQVGVWKKNKKGPKLGISGCKPRIPAGSLTDCTVIYPMPLKKDQPVKRPGPNQPVVVLNHPKPRSSAKGMKVDSVADTSEAVPKCQILKMRLSKVMGEKYEVMGCTVGGFQ